MPRLDPTSGRLPPGFHTATVVEVEAAFVKTFPRSRTRSTIYANWIEYRRAITSIVPIVTQWLNGSFCTNKLDPGDADVVTILDHAQIDAVQPHERILLLGLFHGKKTKDGCGCDAYLIVDYPPGHPGHALAERTREQWRTLFEQVRGEPGARKGIVEVVE